LAFAPRVWSAVLAADRDRAGFQKMALLFGANHSLQPTV
jgi:hypothetical protein